MNFTIRKAEAKDVPRLMDIYNYEVLHGTATFDIHPKDLSERMVWFQEHQERNHPLIVAEMEDGRVAGYASLSSYREKEAYAATAELSLYIAVECRGKGAASALIQEILRLAKEETELYTVISVITAGNDASVHLHEKFGFACCGTMKDVGKKFGQRLSIVNYQLILNS